MPRDPGITGIGPLLRELRQRRGESQLGLALEIGISPRHLSFVETGRARPSEALLLKIAERLGLSLRETNQLLLAAGHAPHFEERPLDSAAMAGVRQALDMLLRAHEPYPGFVVDGQWNIVLANRPGQALARLLPASLKTPTFNLFRASLHEEGLAPLTENFEAWASHLLAILRRTVATSGEPALQDLLLEITRYPRVAALLERGPLPTVPADAVLVPCVLALPSGRLSLLTTLTSFGAPRDITLEGLCVELFYPADEITGERLRAMS